MKRFILFGWDETPLGGFNDFIGYFDDMESAKSSDYRPKNMMLFDSETGVSFSYSAEFDGVSDWELSPISYAARSTYTRPELWTHNALGGIYMLEGDATLQLDGPDDMAEMVIYRNLLDSKFWVRKKDEFHDGRFTKQDFQNMTIQDMVTETARFIIKDMMQSVMKSPEFQKIVHDETNGGPVTNLQAPEVHNEVDHRVNFGYGRIGYD